MPYVLCSGAETIRRVGGLERALGSVSNGLAVSAEKDVPYFDAELHRSKGEILLAQDPSADEEAESLFLRAVEIAKRQDAKSLELRADTSLARLWRRQGKRAEARDLLQPVYDWFTEGFDTQDLKDAKALLDELAPSIHNRSP